MSSSLNYPDARVIIIGDTQVGKTTLISRYIDKVYSQMTTSTITPVFSPSRVQTTSGGEVSLQLWDTAGQERYQSVGQVYYRNANYALICFDSNDPSPQESVKKWHKNIIDCEPNCIIFLASTKIDKFEGCLSDLLETGNELANEIGAVTFFTTSSVTGDGVDNVFEAIADNWETHLKATPKSGEVKSNTIDINHSNTEKKKCC